MKKIQHFFMVDENYKYIDKINDDFKNQKEALLMRKIDGTSCMIKDGKLFARYDAKDKGEPIDFIRIDGRRDTGRKNKKGIPIIHNHGWLPVNETNAKKYGYKYHLSLIEKAKTLKDGTYELIGPKIQNNIEQSNVYQLISHNDKSIYVGDISINEMSFEKIRNLLITLNKDRYLEGFILYFPDGKMAKVRVKNFDKQ